MARSCLNKIQKTGAIRIYQRKQTGKSRKCVGYVLPGRKAVEGAPSPNGLGYHARRMQIGTVMAGADGNSWIVVRRENGSRFWKRFQQKNREKGRRRLYKPTSFQ